MFLHRESGSSTTGLVILSSLSRRPMYSRRCRTSLRPMEANLLVTTVISPMSIDCYLAMNFRLLRSRCRCHQTAIERLLPPINYLQTEGLPDESETPLRVYCALHDLPEIQFMQSRPRDIQISRHDQPDYLDDNEDSSSQYGRSSQYSRSGGRSFKLSASLESRNGKVVSARKGAGKRFAAGTLAFAHH